MAYERKEEKRPPPGEYDHTEAIATREPDAVYEPRSGTAVDQVQSTAYDPYARRRSTVEKLIQAIYLVFGFVEALLVIRFLLRLFGANPQAEFARFIYSITAGLVGPFVGLFTRPRYNGGELELFTLIAIAIYALLAWLLARIVWLVLGETRSAVAATSTSVETRPR